MPRVSSPSPLVGEVARIVRCETGEGSVSADRNPSSAFAEFIIGRRLAPTR